MNNYPSPLGEYTPNDWDSLVIEAAGIELLARSGFALLSNSHDYMEGRIQELIAQKTLASKLKLFGINGAIDELVPIASKLLDDMENLSRRGALLELRDMSGVSASYGDLSLLLQASDEARSICRLIDKQVLQCFNDIEISARERLNGLLGMITV